LSAWGDSDVPSRAFTVESQRDRLLDAMAACCAEKRYAEVSVGDVVTRAGVSRSTFYNLFDDKEACFLDAYDEILGQFVTDVMQAIRTPGLSWEDQAENGLRAALAFMKSEPDFARMCIVDVFSAGPAALERYLSAIRVMATFINMNRDRSGSRGEIPDEIANYLISGAVVVIRSKVVDGDTELLPAIGPDIIYGVLCPYVGQDEALERAERYARTIS
jgi:AcrR family transcriptional regulator